MGLDDWDLQAVVRSCCFREPKATTGAEDPFSSFPVPASINEELMDEEGVLTRFPDLLAARTVVHELEELLKPFFPKVHQRHVLSPQKSSPSSFPGIMAAPPIPAVCQPQQLRQPHRPLPQTPRSKRRKNQQKRVVCQVPAEAPPTDMWAWRKYGQKPIKGSPYPRGYYRCSSSKGCLARKQVERCRTDPNMLVITYTAEHNHPIPTQRNSLAGSTRHRFGAPPNTMPSQTQVGSPYAATCAGDGEQTLLPSNPSSSPLSSSTTAGLSPRTPLTTSMKDEVLRRPEEKRTTSMEDEVEEEEVLLVGDDMAFEDDLLFTNLEGLGRPTATAVATANTTEAVSVTSTVLSNDDAFVEHLFPTPWRTDNAAAAAGGS